MYVQILTNTFLDLESLFVLSLSLVLEDKAVEDDIVRDVEVREGFVVPENLSIKVEYLFSRRDPFRGFDLRFDTMDGV